MRRQVVFIAAIALQSLSCAVNSSMKRDATHPRTVPAQTRSGEVATNPDVVPVLWQMFGDAGFGLRHTEEAAFIVGTEMGRLILVRWPSGGEPDTARWTGRIPDGVVAIVHTHPNWQPLPSRIDVRTAQRSHLPVYGVTAGVISSVSERSGGQGGPAFPTPGSLALARDDKEFTDS